MCYVSSKTLRILKYCDIVTFKMYFTAGIYFIFVIVSFIYKPFNLTQKNQALVFKYYR